MTEIRNTTTNDTLFEPEGSSFSFYLRHDFNDNSYVAIMLPNSNPNSKWWVDWGVEAETESGEWHEVGDARSFNQKTKAWGYFHGLVNDVLLGEVAIKIKEWTSGHRSMGLSVEIEAY